MSSDLPVSTIKTNRFNLHRQFAFLSLLSIVLVGVLTTWFVTRFLEKHLLERDATVSMEFIQSVSEINFPGLYFQGEESPHDRRQLEEFFDHITGIPDVLRANVYDQNGLVIWSNHKELIGKHFSDNLELERALQGQLVVERKHASGHKSEHAYLPPGVNEFLENYIPIRDHGGQVVGVVEVYKVPTALLATIRQGQQLVWTIACIAGTFLYLVLFWIVRRGSMLIEAQQQALVESEKMATVGNMVEAVAHGIRNPIASMRSSAELAMEDSGSGDVRENLQDIIDEIDRLDDWVREMLTFSNDFAGQDHPTPIGEVIQASLDSFGDRLNRQGIEVDMDIHHPLPSVKGDTHLLAKVFNSLIANSLEAMPDGGELRLAAAHNDKVVRININDTGIGVPADLLPDVFSPLVSSKANGLGMGLSLARRILEGYGGSIQLRNEDHGGTTAMVELQVAG